ncbi:Trypsin [Vibrio aerogenes CECT 7868]|uniref:Trypsin n=1 Tax=Vibrio aerogenes CECT 7868 TaxID=1216006 RepID=A0A1M5WXC9_9VIBR|nr:serine protease [Vibrio aerogenes]SHH92249.1 Trypsin [Vibrio aerogenes CECT 7868]
MRIKRTISILAGSILAATQTASAGNIHSEVARIVNGSESSTSQWPFMTALVMKDTSAAMSQFCGGSFIGGRYVLTAAHCVEGLKAGEIDVSIGLTHLSQEKTEARRVGVQAIYTHDDYGNSANDIAVLELEETVDASSIALASQADAGALIAGDAMTVIGWGNKSATGSDFPETLNYVSMPFVDLSTCQALGGNYAGIGEDSLCVGLKQGGKDACQGDSGGPLVREVNGHYKQFGIVSWGAGCAQPDAYGVYTNVGYFSGNGWLGKFTSGVSFTQKTRLTARNINSALRLPVRNLGSEPFEITRIEAPEGVFIVGNSCFSTLYQNSDCEIDVKVNPDLVDPDVNTISVQVYTSHSKADELKMNLIFAQ